MNWFKRNSLLGAVLLLAVAVLPLEGWFWSRSRRQSVRALATLKENEQERDRLARQSPTLSRENEEAIARDLAGAGKVLAALEATLQWPQDGAQTTPPTQAVDLYFNLAAYVERNRTLAARAQVAVNPDERFGFASHAHAGPERGLVPAIWQQRLELQYLVEALLEARPRSLLAVQRERPQTAAQRTRRNQVPVPDTTVTEPAAPGGPTGDFFAFDPALTVRVPGLVDSDAFRLEFTGQTAALRTFLNTLAVLEFPAIVRSVEVEPLAGEGSVAGPVGAGAPVPLVAQNLSRFAVVIECVLLVPAPGRPAP